MNRFLAWWFCDYNNTLMYQTKYSDSWGLGEILVLLVKIILKTP